MLLGTIGHVSDVSHRSFVFTPELAFTLKIMLRVLTGMTITILQKKATNLKNAYCHHPQWRIQEIDQNWGNGTCRIRGVGNGLMPLHTYSIFLK